MISLTDMQGQHLLLQRVEKQLAAIQLELAKIHNFVDYYLPNMTDIAATLQERGSRYGDFGGHARITILLKRVIQLELEARGKMLADDQQEALDMIFHKIGRIINGDPDYADSWVDIAGYAKLVADRLENPSL